MGWGICKKEWILNVLNKYVSDVLKMLGIMMTPALSNQITLCLMFLITWFLYQLRCNILRIIKEEPSHPAKVLEMRANYSMSMKGTNSHVYSWCTFPHVSICIGYCIWVSQILNTLWRLFNSVGPLSLPKYVIWSSWISLLLAILVLRYGPSKKTTFVSYCFSQPTFTHISGTKCPILMGFSAKCSLCDVF